MIAHWQWSRGGIDAERDGARTTSSSSGSKKALKPGGLYISEYFHADSDVAKTGAGGWKTG